MNTSITKTSIKDIVSVVKIGQNVFTNQFQLSIPFRGRSVYGGTICAQALHSAIKTIPSGFIPHSLHAYFFLGGNPELPIEYKVETLRDGGSFLSREVKAYQLEKVIFMQTCSFTLKVPKRQPKAPQPKHNKTTPDDVIASFNTEFFSKRESFNKGVLEKKLLEFPANSDHYINGWLDHLINVNVDQKFKPNYWSYGIDPNHEDINKRPDQIALDLFWKSQEPINDEMLNYIIFAYISDGFFISQAVKFQNRPGWSAEINASLDHTIYFHRPFRADDWLLYHVTNPKSGDSRMLMQGDLYTRNHELVASVTQEGLVSVGPKLSLQEYRDWYVERVLSSGKAAEGEDMKMKPKL